VAAATTTSDGFLRAAALARRTSTILSSTAPRVRIRDGGTEFRWPPATYRQFRTSPRASPPATLQESHGVRWRAQQDQGGTGRLRLRRTALAPSGLQVVTQRRGSDFHRGFLDRSVWTAEYVCRQDRILAAQRRRGKARCDAARTCHGNDMIVSCSWLTRPRRGAKVDRPHHTRQPKPTPTTPEASPRPPARALSTTILPLVRFSRLRSRSRSQGAGFVDGVRGEVSIRSSNGANQCGFHQHLAAGGKLRQAMATSPHDRLAANHPDPRGAKYSSGGAVGARCCRHFRACSQGFTRPEYTAHGVAGVSELAHALGCRWRRRRCRAAMVLFVAAAAAATG